tara:strand:+ start:1951 stop:4167 length:2217 start_codon:yes stop_codon:yes gene_type:complete
VDKDLFSFQSENELQKNAPLAERLRPKTLDEFIGQSAILAEGRLLRRAIAADRVGNLILFGPPGVGKTTLAKIIAANTRSSFRILNAVLAGVKDLREEVQNAQKRLGQHGLKTTLFIDEVHRFNTSQQDALLPWVENGTITLIGATTENPYFEVNNALLSRARVFRLQKLNNRDLYKVLERALNDSDNGYGKLEINIHEDAAAHLINYASGDARTLLNSLELAVETSQPEKGGLIDINIKTAEDSIQQRAILYDKDGEAHFDTISAFIKSIRGSDPDAAIFWLARMIDAGENPRFIFRRLLISAGEDIGLADPNAMVIVEACASAFERIGLPEGIYPLTEATIYLATTEKSNSIKAFYEAQKLVRNSHFDEVPVHLKDSHRDKKTFGDGEGYQYPHSYSNNWVAQQYLPKELHGEIFWCPTNHGWEGKQKSKLFERRASQLALKNDVIEFTSEPNCASGGSFFAQWITRYIGTNGDRMQMLLEKLWEDVHWRRNDRVLVLGASNLFWSLEPLKKVSDGGVYIYTDSDENLNRLKSEINLLDEDYKPIIIGPKLDSVKNILGDIEFECVGGRISSHDFKHKNLKLLWNIIKEKCSIKTSLNLLITTSTWGPMKSIMQLDTGVKLNQEEISLLKKIINLENDYLNESYHLNRFTDYLLEIGFSLNTFEWSENLSLRVDNDLKEKWICDTSPYKKLIKDNLSEEALALAAKIIQTSIGVDIPQKLSHIKITGGLSDLNVYS